MRYSASHHLAWKPANSVFFTDDDRNVYLDWLKEYYGKHGVDILAYCLLTNHIHLIAVPETEIGLQRVLKPLHMRYAQRVNRDRGWKGHLWQGRFFSSPLGDAYTQHGHGLRLLSPSPFGSVG